MSDNRLMQRFQIAIPAHIKPQSGPAAEKGIDLFSRDVCSGGAFFPTTEPLEVGTRVLVRMLLLPHHTAAPTGKTAEISLAGTILRIETEGMAVRFDSSYKISSVRQWGGASGLGPMARQDEQRSTTPLDLDSIVLPFESRRTPSTGDEFS